MDKKQYQVGITIIQGRNIKGKDSAGTSDPFVKISCAGLPTQVTQKKYETNTAVWNQSFTFSGLYMNQWELETFELIAEVYDHNAIMTNELIGFQSIGLSTLYRSLNHEFYKVWLQLFNPLMPNENHGYLQVSCFIVGANERPPVHAQDDDALDDEEQMDDDMLNNLTEEQKTDFMKRKMGIFIVKEPIMIQKGYQLSVNILKAEGLPDCDSSGRCNTFVSIRAVGCPMATHVVENHNPNFGRRIQFPVNVPILNDKITARIWHKYAGMPDICIANIPEYPSPYDFFNLTKLLSCDGRMKTTWFNLYGVHPLDRGWFKDNKQKKKEGSSYLGRILISMQLVPCERPQLFVMPVQPTKEPQSSNYLFWVDTYDLVNCEEAKGRQLWAVATIGSYKTPKYAANYKEQSATFFWKKVQMDAMVVNLPVDVKQTPDIIVNIYYDKFMKGETRLGYVRIPARDCQKKSSNPQWYRLKSPHNDMVCPGIILMNVQYVWEGAHTDRFPKPRGGEGSYKLFAQILSGFEIAPTLKEEELLTKVDIKIGNMVISKEIITTEPQPGRYPQWNFFKLNNVTLDKNLQFASDMRVILKNRTKRLLKKDDWDTIGEFYVPVSSLCTLYSKPQFFNVVNYEGQLQGQILARFFLKQVDAKRKKDEFLQLQQEFKAINDIGFTVNIDIALFGIRNLYKNALKPEITLKLTHDTTDQIHTFKEKQPLNSKNPNFGRKFSFKNIELSVEPLLWPQLQVIVKDEGGMLGFSGMETTYTTISLIEFALGILDAEEIKFSQIQLSRNQHKIQLVQKQINPLEYFNKLVKAGSKLGQLGRDTYERNESFNNNENRNNNMDGDDDDEDMEFGVNMVGGMKVKELGVVMANGERMSVMQEKNFWVDEDSSDDDDDSEEADAKDVQLNINDGLLNAIDRSDTSDSNISRKYHGKDRDLEMGGDEKGRLMGGTKKGLGASMKLNDNKKGINQNGVVIDFNEVIEIACKPADKQSENKIRQQKIDRLNKQLDKIQLSNKWNKSKDTQEEKEMLIYDIRTQIDELNEEVMTEEKFWGYVMDNAEAYEYGRDVLKEGTYEQLLTLPYHCFPLFTNSSWYGSKTAQVGGMLRSGELTGATFKLAVKIKSADDDDSNASINSKDGENQPQNYSKKKTRETNQTPDIIVANDKVVAQNKAGDQEIKMLQQINEIYQFDITKDKFLECLMKNLDFKVRVYILRCQNLSAIDSYLDLKQKLAGQMALCSADPFPVIIVGNGKNDNNQQKVKYANDRDKYVPQNLNPKFNRVYEFDGRVPDDWKIEIQICDRGRLAYTDALIGSTTIDLEDRFFGNLRRQTLTTLEKIRDIAKKQLQKQERKEYPNKAYISKLNKKMEEVVKQIAKIGRVDPKPLPVEFRELRHPNKLQAQGIIEMWCEVLTYDEARKMPIARLQDERKDDYEIRLVVWETRDIPVPQDGSVDLYVKVAMDPTGWAGNPIEKQTDVHSKSVDGRGVFNYRFKFDIQWPCEFPLLKFQVYDQGVFSNQAIGETTMDIKQTMAKVQKEGKVDDVSAWLPFFQPGKKDERKGRVKVSITILPKADADLKPVGEAQDEPNESPFLEAPVEGRGFADQIGKFVPYDLSAIKIPRFNMFRNMIIIAVVAGIVILVLILIMFLKK